jgi:hypothetical protein
MAKLRLIDEIVKVFAANSGITEEIEAATNAAVKFEERTTIEELKLLRRWVSTKEGCELIAALMIVALPFNEMMRKEVQKKKKRVKRS